MFNAEAAPAAEMWLEDAAGAGADFEVPTEEAPMIEPSEAPTATPPPANGGSAPPPPRVRKHFPETLLWRPELITDDQGEVEIDIELADSITTWRLSTSAMPLSFPLISVQLVTFPMKRPLRSTTGSPVRMFRGFLVVILKRTISFFLDFCQRSIRAFRPMKKGL